MSSFRTTPDGGEDVARRGAEPSGGEPSGGVTLRVVVLCLMLAAIFGYVSPIADVKLNNTYLGAQPLPPGAVAALLLMLLVVNPLLRLLSSRLAFGRNEVLTIYITCLFAALVPGHGAENYFVANIIGGFYFATRENGWLDFLAPYLKPWFTPALRNGGYDAAGQRVVDGWYNGLRAGEAIPWGAWLVPLVVWGALILATYWMWACLAVMLRAQWAEREALAFPLLRLPLKMTHGMDRPDGEGGITPFFRSPMMWVGFGIAVVAQGLNGLNFYFPEIPRVPLDVDTGALFTEPPWNQLGWFPVAIYPIAVGISYLLTAEISFSLWFFYLFFKTQYIVAYYLGYMPNVLPNTIGWAGIPAKTFTGYQQLGAYLVYAGAIFWSARRHLRHIARRALGRAVAGADERREALPYPVAFWGFVLSFAFIVAWSVAAGVRLDVAIAIWVFYLICVVALTRVVIESGMLYVQQGFTPLGTFAQLLGSGEGRWLTPSSLAPAAIIQSSMIIDLRANLMPSFMHSFKLARERDIRMRPLLALIAAVIFISFSIGIWQDVRLGYQNGGLSLHGNYAQGLPQLAASVAKDLSGGAPGMAWTNWLWLGWGSVFTYGIMLARSRFLWFPLHPIGLLLCLTHPMFTLWFSVFLGWLANLVTHFGGTNNYRKLVPGFLGLALGDVTMMLFWLAVDSWQGRVGHNLLPV